MRPQRILLGLTVAMMVGVPAAAADSYGALRWHSDAAPLGLRVGQDGLRVPCGGFTLSCEAGTLPLYTSARAPRSLSMQITGPRDSLSMPGAGPQDLDVSFVGQAGIAPDLGVYGRVGTSFNRAAPGLALPHAGEGGLTYGVGLSWDFSRRGSAALALDSYDLRGSLGEMRDVRTSLGLRWRY